MSRILHLMNLSQRYRGSKGVRETRVEDGALGNLAPPGDLEESDSRQIMVCYKLLLWALAPHQVHGLQRPFAWCKLP